MQIDFDKYVDNLVPTVIQDYSTNKVLMVGFMNQDALNKTIESKQVTFFSRSKKALWTKGETSGNFLEVKEILVDCDEDTILIKANPKGPTCHTGQDTCFGEINNNAQFINTLEQIIEQRKLSTDPNSYVKSLFTKGINKIAQKVGEEAVELVIEAKDNNDNLFLNEAADLLFHYLILLQAKGFNLQQVENILKERHKK
jgi:phosphoribosyl-AMP cyclohydrolase / phosphoribosyl-ATP pyrophosphohydrolase